MARFVLTRSKAVYGIGIRFYGPDASAAGVYDVAMEERAPNSRWADSASVRSGKGKLMIGVQINSNGKTFTPMDSQSLANQALEPSRPPSV